MLRFISWSDFLLALLILLVSYWITIILVFYKRNIARLFRKASALPINPENNSKQYDGDQFERCNACASILKTLIRGKALEGPNKIYLLKEVKIAVHPFIDFKGTQWQYPINNLIKHELWQNCSMAFEEMDIENIWES